MHTITKIISAGALAVSLSAAPAQAGAHARPDTDAGWVIGALFLGLVGLLVATGGGGDTDVSTKNGPALDLELPDPGTQTVKDF